MLTRLVVSALMLVNSGAAVAAVIGNPGPSDSIFQIQNFSPFGQSFTAVDSQLISIGFGFGVLNAFQGEVPVTITLLQGDGIGGLAIAERTFTPVEAGLSFADFTGTTLTVGAFYTALISTSNSFWGVDASVDLFAGGQAYLTDSVTGLIPDRDLIFEVSGSTAVPGIPEPASWALLIAGFGLVGAAMRRRSLAAA